MRIVYLLAMSLAWAAPTGATPTLTEIEQAQPVPGAEPAQYAEALRAYGQWVVRLSELQAPLQAGLSGLSGEWETVRRSGRPEALAAFRASVSAVLSQLDSVHQELSALPAPDVSLIAFPAPLRPEALVQEMLRVNRELRAAMAGFIPAVDAIARNDAAGADAAVRRTLEGLGLVLESNVVVSRAMLSILPRDGAEWEVGNIEHLFYRGASRAFRAWPHLLGGTSDPTLASELLQIADELDRAADSGELKNERDLAELDAGLDAAAADVDPAVGALQRQAAGAFEATRQIFTLARRLASQIRSGARSLEGERLDLQPFAALFVHFREFRRDYDAAVRAMGAAMAAH